MKKNLVTLSKTYDMWHKRVLSLLLAVVMVVGMIPIISLSVSAATMDVTTFNSKLETFKTERYPDGSKYVNNPSLTGGYECFGFANELAVYMFGSYPTNSMSAATVNSGWTRVYGGDAVNNISVGDVVRYGFHSIFITGVSGDNIYYCQANIPSGTNKVTYDNYISRSELKTKVSKKLTSANTDKTGWVAHFVNGISTAPTPPPTPNHSCGSCVSINKTGSVTGIVNIRTAPNTSSTVICEFTTGTSVTITAKCGNWYLVKNSGETIGWAHANYIKVKESTSSGHECSSCVSVNKSGTVKSDVNVRSGPGTSYTFLFEYYTGTDLSISVECNGWYFVSDAGGNSGWVAGNFVDVDSTHYHDYVWNYEAAHPHREYVKCSCGDYEYTGENYFDKIYSTENEYAHPHKEYKICGICGQTEYTGATRYVDSCTTCNPPHTHSYIAYHEGVHPHREYMKCSCGDYYYLDSYYYDSSCTTCNPPHTHSYTTYHDATHPHREYKKCSCGDSYYLDSYYYDSGCTTCNPPKYTITFDANGGNWSGGNLVKTHDMNVTIPNAYPTRTGYTFRGWSTSRNGTIAYFGGETYTANSSITLYAVWKANTYTVKYNANGGDGTMQSSTHIYDTAKGLSSNTFTRSKYTFLGWSTSSSATTATYMDKQSVKNLASANGATVNLYAVWYETAKYTVAFDTNGAGTVIGAQTKYHDIDLSLLYYTPPRTGYTFKEWKATNGVVYAPGATYSANEPTTLVAQWTPNTYTVKYNANGGSGSMSNSSHTYDTSKALSANAFTRSGYTFLGWSTSSSATSATYTNKQSVKNLTSTNGGTVNLYAVWKPNTYTVKYNANGGTRAPSTQTKIQGESIVLSEVIPTRTGYKFINWKSSDGTLYNPGDEYSADLDTILIAQWQGVSYKVKFDANGGEGSMGHNLCVYDSENSLDPNQFEREGYVFSGWSLNSDATEVVFEDKAKVLNLSSVDGDTVWLYAVWKKTETFEIMILYYEDGEDKEITLTKEKGSVIDLSKYSVSRPGYTFIAWVEFYSEQSYSGNDKFIVSKDAILVSGMQANTYIVYFDATEGVVTEDLKSVKFDSAYSQLPTPTRNGYTFEGWFTEQNGGERITTDTVVKTPENHTIYAHWSQDVQIISPSAVSFNKTSTTLRVGDTETLTATVTPNNATNKSVSWTSSNSSVASVLNGVITAKAAGTATITAKTVDGNKTATCVVTVNEQPIVAADVIYTISSASGKPGDSVEITLSVASDVVVNGLLLDNLTYDKNVFEFVEFADYSDLITTSALGANGVDSANGVISLGYTEAVKPNGEICVIKLRVKDAAEDGEYTISVDGAASANGQKLPSIVNSGKITISKWVSGDFDNDEKLDMKDVVHFMNWINFSWTGKYPMIYDGDKDFNKDGNVDMKDVVYFMNYVNFSWTGNYDINW